MVANAVADVASPEIPLAITGLLASPANPLLPAHQTGTSNRLLTIPVNIGAKPKDVDTWVYSDASLISATRWCYFDVDTDVMGKVWTKHDHPTPAQISICSL